MILDALEGLPPFAGDAVRAQAGEWLRRARAGDRRLSAVTGVS